MDHNENKTVMLTKGAGFRAYESPSIAYTDIRVEKGFAQSATGEELDESDWEA